MANAPANPSQTKDTITREFRRLNEEYKVLKARIATKEEQAEKAAEQEVVESASVYTAEQIVKSLADLQLRFSDIIEDVSGTLQSESDKLQELRRAITIQTAYQKRVKDIRVAADALDILQQENAETMRSFEAEAANDRESLEEEITETREAWSLEQQEHEQAVEEHNERLAKERKLAEEEHAYELERARKQERDAFDEEQRRIERELAQKEEAREKDWTEREATLAANQATFEENKAKVDAFPEKLEAATKDAREAAIKDAAKEASNRASLLEAEVKGNREVYTRKVSILESTIQKQQEQIVSLSSELQRALSKVQDLAVRAMETSTGKKGEARS